MKRITIFSIVAAGLLLSAFVIVRAEIRGQHGFRMHRWRQFGPVSHLAHELELSDAQKTQIHDLLQSDRSTFSGHIHELLAENEAMDAIATSSNPSQEDIQKIADRESRTVAALLVEKASLQSKVFLTVLTPEQRTKFNELQKKWESHLERLADHIGAEQTAK